MSTRKTLKLAIILMGTLREYYFNKMYKSIKQERENYCSLCNNC